MLVPYCLLGILFLNMAKSSPLHNSTSYIFNQEEIIDELKELKKRVDSNERVIAADRKTIVANRKTISDNVKTIEANQKTIRTNKKTISDLEQRLASYAQQCSLEAHDTCGPCICKEDRRLRKKYFCDCSILGVRRDCLEFYQEGHHVDGLYVIEQLKKRFQVFCDMTNDGGGWTVIMRRNGDPSVNFYRTWDEYKHGFGDLQHEHWLGNEYMHAMSLSGQCTGANDLRVEMQEYSTGAAHWAKYDHFAVNSEYHNYRLAVGKYSGNANDQLSYHNKMDFSTYDKDNDVWSDNCARVHGKGGWWYNNCIGTNPTGRYFFYGDKKLSPDNIDYAIQWNGYVKFIEMKIRRNKDGNCTD